MALPFLGIGVAAARLYGGRAALGRIGGVALGREIGDALEEQPVTLRVDSSFIREISWFPGDTLVVQMHTGKEWSYSCSRDIFEEFARAPSKGKYFNQNIK